MTATRRIVFKFATTLLVSLVAMSGAFGQSQPPIRIGSTLALTGPLAATSLVHKVVGEIYVEQLNKRGGLLGRQVEWIVKDDQSKPDLARTLYEQLITSDKVDLLMGPYATGAILSAMGVAQRYNKVLVHHTFGIPSMAKYDMQFPAWSLGPDPATTVPTTVFDALAASPKPHALRARCSCARSSRARARHVRASRRSSRPRDRIAVARCHAGQRRVALHRR